MTIRGTTGRAATIRRPYEPARPEAWQDSAACLDHDPELFFPVGVGQDARQQAVEAIAVCLACPVRDACLSAGMRGRESGVWGGKHLNEGRFVHYSRRETA